MSPEARELVDAAKADARAATLRIFTPRPWTRGMGRWSPDTGAGLPIGPPIDWADCNRLYHWAAEEAA